MQSKASVKKANEWKLYLYMELRVEAKQINGSSNSA